MPSEALFTGRSTPASTPGATASEIGLAWFIELRWWEGIAQVLAITVASAAGSAIPLAPMLGLAGMTFLSNAALVQLRRRTRLDSAAALGSLLILDLALLTGLLAFSGGPANPFSILYLVNVTLATILLSASWAWTTVLLSIGCYALLFVVAPMGAHGAHAGRTGNHWFDMHLWGMFFAFAAAAALVANFVTRVTRALRDRESELVKARERAARSERVASIMALAAGTAHEMGTPLATIAVVARELEREAAHLPDRKQILEDARLVRREVERCGRLLQQLGTGAGEIAGEIPCPVTFQEVLEQLRATLPVTSAGRLQAHFEEPAARVAVPRRALVQVLGNLVRNALEASAPEAEVDLHARRSGRMLQIQVRDHGRGMSSEVLTRAREPFFTTKEPGAGLGLGLFLVDRFAAQLDGTLSIASRPGAGTTVTLEIPA